MFGQPLRGEPGQYLAVAVLAGLDSVLGGIRSGMEGKFRNDVFVTGFVSNILIAFFLAWLGDRIFINLFLVIGLIFGTRIFNNLSLIRRYLLTRWQDAHERRRLQALSDQAAQQSDPPAP
jgi:small basic protein